MYKSLIDSILLANQEIYFLLESSNLKESTNIKGAGGDISLVADIEAEKIFVKYLSKFGSIYSEESGVIESNEGSFKIILDPIDGSDNFLSNIPYYGTSIYIEDSEFKLSVVVNFISKEVFIKFNNQEFEILELFSNKSINKKDSTSKVAIFERAYLYPDMAKLFFEHSIKFRSLGALALSLVNARSVDFVLFIGKKRDYDIKAALHIVSELFIEVNENFILVSKDKNRFNFILNLVNSTIK
jgi:myo-inositol-1(or 4)-monophosphatase